MKRRGFIKAALALLSLPVAAKTLVLEERKAEATATFADAYEFRSQGLTVAKLREARDMMDAAEIPRGTFHEDMRRAYLQCNPMLTEEQVSTAVMPERWRRS